MSVGSDMLNGSAGATPADDVTIGGARIERGKRRSTNAKSDKDFEFPRGTANTVMSRCSQHNLNVENHTFGSCHKNADYSATLNVRASFWLRPMAALGAFASLNKYVNYLVSRAYLGNATERKDLLSQLNRKLRAEQPEVPDFRLEHLGSASILKKEVKNFSHGLSAAFIQEVNLGDNSWKRVMGVLRQEEKGEELVVSITATEFSRAGRN